MEIIKQACSNLGLTVKDWNLKWNGELAKSKTPIEYIVVHHDVWQGGTMLDIHNDHVKNKGWRGTGYHVRIRTDGTVELGRPFGYYGGHCSQQEMNGRSIGMVYEGNFEKTTPSDKQYEVGAALTKEIIRLSGTIKPQNVRPHNYFTPKACPGKNFPMVKLLADIMKKDVSNFDKGLEWLTKNKIINSPDYWHQNAVKGGAIDGMYARILIEMLGVKMNG